MSTQSSLNIDIPPETLCKLLRLREFLLIKKRSGAINPFRMLECIIKNQILYINYDIIRNKCDEFRDSSDETIRKNLRQLEDTGLIKYTIGGYKINEQLIPYLGVIKSMLDEILTTSSIEPLPDNSVICNMLYYGLRYGVRDPHKYLINVLINISKTFNFISESEVFFERCNRRVDVVWYSGYYLNKIPRFVFEVVTSKDRLVHAFDSLICVRKNYNIDKLYIVVPKHLLYDAEMLNRTRNYSSYGIKIIRAEDLLRLDSELSRSREFLNDIIQVIKII